MGTKLYYGLQHTANNHASGAEEKGVRQEASDNNGSENDSNGENEGNGNSNRDNGLQMVVWSENNSEDVHSQASDESESTVETIIIPEAIPVPIITTIYLTNTEVLRCHEGT